MVSVNDPGGLLVSAQNLIRDLLRRSNFLC